MHDDEILKEIFWVGVPASLETLLTSVAYIVNNNLAVSYGELTVDATGIAQKIMTVGYVPLLLALNYVFGFGGMLWAQPVTEIIMMAVSVVLLLNVIKNADDSYKNKMI